LIAAITYGTSATLLRDQKYLLEVRRLVDGLRAVNALEPHAMEDPGVSPKGSGDEDDDVGQIEECEGDEE
jgi:hypothetical protein